MRKFVCPETNAACEYGVCKKDVYCHIQKEDEVRFGQIATARELKAAENEADVVRMMVAIAKKQILDEYRAKYGKTFDRGEKALAEAADKLLKRSEYATDVRRVAVEIVGSIKQDVAKLFATGVI